MRKFLRIDVIQNGRRYNVEAYNINNGTLTMNARLCMNDFESLGEVNHYLLNVGLQPDEKIKMVITYVLSNKFLPSPWFSVMKELKSLKRAS